MAGRTRVLTTARCALETWRADDWREMAALTHDPAMMRHISHGRPWPAERAREFVSRQMTQQDELGFCTYRLAVGDDPSLAGVCGLQPTVVFDGIELTWWVARRHWGQGLATECARAAVDFGFGTLGLGELLAVIDKENVASQRVAEKLGMSVRDEMAYAGMRVKVHVLAASRWPAPA